jgi:hypothetical protein
MKFNFTAFSSKKWNESFLWWSTLVGGKHTEKNSEPIEQCLLDTNAGKQQS